MKVIEVEIDDEVATAASARAAEEGLTLEEALARAARSIAGRPPKLLRGDPAGRAAVMRVLRNSKADLSPGFKFDRESTYDRGR